MITVADSLSQVDRLVLDWLIVEAPCSAGMVATDMGVVGAMNRSVFERLIMLGLIERIYPGHTDFQPTTLGEEVSRQLNGQET